jgi:hypothetical protein
LIHDQWIRGREAARGEQAGKTGRQEMKGEVFHFVILSARLGSEIRRFTPCGRRPNGDAA